MWKTSLPDHSSDEYSCSPQLSVDNPPPAKRRKFCNGWKEYNEDSCMMYCIMAKKVNTFTKACNNFCFDNINKHEKTADHK